MHTSGMIREPLGCRMMSSKNCCHAPTWQP